MTRLIALGLVVASAACTPIKDHMNAAAERADQAGCATAERCDAEKKDGATSDDTDAKPGRDAGPGRASAMVGSGPSAASSDKPSNGGAGAAAESGASGARARAVPSERPAPGLPNADAPDASAMQADTPSGDMLVRPDAADCNYFEVRARSDAEGSGYVVPSGEQQQCFLVDAGFDAPTQAFGFSPIIDNPSLVNNIVLRTLERSDIRGPVVTCNDPYPTHQMVALWAPGADDWYYPKDMGIDLGRGLFLLEVHYVNSGGPTNDRSGMRVCTSKQLRPRTASMSWLGNQAFTIPAGVKDYAVNGRCAPVNQADPIHILRVLPFMNTHGRRASMQIDRIDGSTERILDQPFHFDDRKIYDAAATVRVGDQVLSTCYYDNDLLTNVNVGTSNDNELCHFIVLAYPPHALVADQWSVENNSCIGGP